MRPTPSRAVAAWALVSVLLASCGLLVPRTFETVLPWREDPRRDLPVSLVDRTGLVIGLSPAEVPGPGAPGLDGIQADPRGFVFRWTGGACDERTTLRLEATGDGTYELTSITARRGNACILVGLMRGVVVQTLQPLDPSSVHVTAG